MKDNYKKTNIYSKIIASGIGVNGILIAYKYYQVHLANNLTLGGTVPSWFTSLVLLVPFSPIIGSSIEKIKNKPKNETEDLSNIINNFKGE